MIRVRGEAGHPNPVDYEVLGSLGIVIRSVGILVILPVLAGWKCHGAWKRANTHWKAPYAHTHSPPGCALKAASTQLQPTVWGLLGEPRRCQATWLAGLLSRPLSKHDIIGVTRRAETSKSSKEIEGIPSLSQNSKFQIPSVFWSRACGREQVHADVNKHKHRRASPSRGDQPWPPVSYCRQCRGQRASVPFAAHTAW